MGTKASKNILLFIMGVLILALVIVSLLNANRPAIPNICGIIALVCSACYCFFLYSKPHGNMLKFAFLFFAISRLFSDAYILSTDTHVSLIGTFSLMSTAIICYCAGRLNRIEQNRYLLGIIDVFYYILSVYECIRIPSLSLISIISMFIYPITLTVLLIAYFVRYKEHKEAGLTDAPKTK